MWIECRRRCFWQATDLVLLCHKKIDYYGDVFKYFMRIIMAKSLEKRFEEYCKVLTGALAHADRVTPASW